MKKEWRFFGGAFLLIFIFFLLAYMGGGNGGVKVREFFSQFPNFFNKYNLSAVFTAATEDDMKYIYVEEGKRKEEIAEAFSKKLGWNDLEKKTFSEKLGCYPESDEGYLFPGGYVVYSSSGPDDVKGLMVERFHEEAGESLDHVIEESPISMEKAVIIASLIQREAAGKNDMNLISGIIWNRLLAEIPLAIDATLQYAKGDSGVWWPHVQVKDKFIDSPYNTYLNAGLPPTAIASPGLAAIAAAFNPSDTSCFYYIHDSLRRIHCSETYEGHKRNIELYLK